MAQKVHGNDRYAMNLMDAVTWMKERTIREDNFLAVDLESEELGYFTAFAGRPYIQSLDLRHYRGPGVGESLFSTFYDLKSYIYLREYYDAFLGISIDEPSNRLERSSQLSMMQGMIFDLEQDELREKKSMYGKKFNYVLTTKAMVNIPLPSYSNNDFFIYKITNDDRTL